MNSKDNQAGTPSCKMNNYKWSRYKKNKQVNSTKGRKKNIQGSKAKPYETKEEATIRRFHDAQRMARFRARKRKALEEIKTFKTGNLNKFSELKESIMFKNINYIIDAPSNAQFQSNFHAQNPAIIAHSSCQQNKYSELLTVIQELGKDIKLTYAGNKISAERMKIGIIRARKLIKECLLETQMTS